MSLHGQYTGRHDTAGMMTVGLVYPAWCTARVVPARVVPARVVPARVVHVWPVLISLASIDQSDQY